MPDPRNPRSVRHTLIAVLALTACAVLAGATSLRVAGEWIADALSCVLERLGIRPDPLFLKRCAPAETTGRRLLGRIDSDALDRAVWRLAGRPAPRHRRPAARTGGRRQEPARSGRGQGLEGSPARCMRPRPRNGPGPARHGREEQ
ncbi:transposase family protein [Streptomyces sp. AHU1]|uniref:transposase family protein n=1 Tax=Streptomyces sp. AHU1 TaxID=3377215 RepID=UPI003878441A